jgi:WD40 repeat protein
VACHGPSKTKGGFQLHTFDALLKGGESKEPAVSPGHPVQSKVYQLLIAKDADDRMPQKDDALPAAQIALIQRWIQEGARFDGPNPKATLASLLPPAKHPEPPASYQRPVPILALAFSPDGEELVASGYHELTFWNPLNGALLRRIKDMPQQVHSLSFNRDGSVLAVSGGTPGRSGEVKLVDSKTGAILKTLATAPDLLLALAFDPDARRLAVGGADNVLRVFEVASGKEELRIEQHADWILGLAFSPESMRIASASRDKTARLFDSKTGELEETYVGHGQPIFTVVFSAKGQLVLTGGRDKVIHAWQAKDAKKAFEIGGFGDGVLRCCSDGDLLFSCSAELVREHRVDEKEKKAELVRTFTGHRDVVYALAYHGPTKRLASGSFDGEVRVWDASNGGLLVAFSAAPGYRTAPKSE